MWSCKIARLPARWTYGEGSLTRVGSLSSAAANPARRLSMRSKKKFQNYEHFPTTVPIRHIAWNKCIQHKDRSFFDLIGDVNPELVEKSERELALYVTCTIEGMTMFVGVGESHESSLASMKQMACESFLRLLHTH